VVPFDCDEDHSSSVTAVMVASRSVSHTGYSGPTPKARTIGDTMKRIRKIRKIRRITRHANWG
jgi:hypothetical protein